MALACLTIVTLAVTLAVEVATDFSLILLPLYMAIGGVTLVVSMRTLRVLKADDYVTLIEVMPSSLRGLVSRTWSLSGLPMPDPMKTR